MVKIDGSVIIQIVNFIVLIWILNQVLYRPIRNILSQRKQKVAGLEQTVQSADAGVQEKDAAFNEGLREARGKGAKEKEAMIQAAQAEEREIVGRINAKAQEELARVREKVAAEAEAVRAALMNEIDTFAKDIGKKILGRAV